MFKGLFGSSKKESVTTEGAVEKLRGLQETLEKRQEFLEAKIDSSMKNALKNKMNKPLALRHLKEKKKYEAQLKTVDGTLTNLDFQISALQSAKSNAEIFKAMQEGSKALAKEHGNMDIDKVHDTMDDMAEQHQIADEISNAIAAPIGIGAMADEDDLLAELEELEQMELDTQLVDIPTAPATSDKVPTGMPSAPTHVPKEKVTDEEKELAELADWAS